MVAVNPTTLLATVCSFRLEMSRYLQRPIGASALVNVTQVNGRLQRNGTRKGQCEVGTVAAVDAWIDAVMAAARDGLFRDKGGRAAAAAIVSGQLALARIAVLDQLEVASCGVHDEVGRVTGGAHAEAHAIGLAAMRGTEFGCGILAFVFVLTGI